MDVTPHGWEGTDRLLKLLGLNGKQVTKLTISLSMNVDEIVTITAQYTAHPTEEEANEIINILEEHHDMVEVTHVGSTHREFMPRMKRNAESEENQLTPLKGAE